MWILSDAMRLCCGFQIPVYIRLDNQIWTKEPEGKS